MWSAKDRSGQPRTGVVRQGQEWLAKDRSGQTKYLFINIVIERTLLYIAPTWSLQERDSVTKIHE